jgi:hypothetical protein
LLRDAKESTIAIDINSVGVVAEGSFGGVNWKTGRGKVLPQLN